MTVRAGPYVAAAPPGAHRLLRCRRLRPALLPCRHGVGRHDATVHGDGDLRCRSAVCRCRAAVGVMHTVRDVTARSLALRDVQCVGDAQSVAETVSTLTSDAG